MKFNIMCSVLLMGVSSVSIAAIKESCPEPSAIRHTAGIYTAPTRAEGGEWLGVVSSSKPTAIKAFNTATFYSGESVDDTIGMLSKCAYTSESGDHVDLRYQVAQTSDVQVKLANKKAWERKEGPFGLVVYECSDKKTKACAFVQHR